MQCSNCFNIINKMLFITRSRCFKNYYDSLLIKPIIFYWFRIYVGRSTYMNCQYIEYSIVSKINVYWYLFHFSCHKNVLFDTLLNLQNENEIDTESLSTLLHPCRAMKEKKRFFLLRISIYYLEEHEEIGSSQWSCSVSLTDSWLFESLAWHYVKR